MLRYELKTLFRRFEAILGFLIFTLLWFFIEAKYMRIPDFTLQSLDILNTSYGTQFQTKEAFQSYFGTIVLEKIPWDSSGVAIFLPALAGILIAPCFSSREAELIISRGHSKAFLFTYKVLMFYCAIWLMHGFTLLLHISRIGFASFLTLDWFVFLRVWLIRSIYISSWLSVSVLFAFSTQNTFLTIGLSYIYVFLTQVIFSLKLLKPFCPLSYLLQREIWIAPYNNLSANQGLIVSAIYFGVFTVITFILYKKRDLTY